MQTSQAQLNTDLDSADASVEHSEMIRTKPFLHKIYNDNYLFFKNALEGAPAGKVIELGSGGGFIKQVIPEAITSDVVELPNVDTVISATQLPFEAGSLRAILMVNVFHHIQDVEQFLREATRCLKPGGVIAMVEPANTPFSRFIYSNFHHEPFEPQQQGWALPPGGRMSVANDALPWIVFQRDRQEFERKFTQLKLESYQNFMPFRYILSGGVSKPQLLPSMAYPVVLGLEKLIAPLNGLLGMFCKIAVRRVL